MLRLNSTNQIVSLYFYDNKKQTTQSGLPRGHNKNDKMQKKSYFYQIQSILTLWQKIDFLFFIYF
jgi:hypothetical protein